MKTTLLVIGIGGIVLIGLFIIAYKLTSSPSPIPQKPQTATTTTQGNAGLPIINVAPLPTSSSQTAPSVGSVEVKDVLQDPDMVKDLVNVGYYYLGYHTSQGTGDMTSTTKPPYIIEYISATHYFSIALLQEPIGITRETMQQYLMLHLGLSQDQMCKLDYMVSVPGNVNEQFSGESLGFSFCPGATTLPK